MTAFENVSVQLQSDLLVIGDSIRSDRHHASNGNDEADDPQNQISGLILAFQLSVVAPRYFISIPPHDRSHRLTK